MQERNYQDQPVPPTLFLITLAICCLCCAMAGRLILGLAGYVADVDWIQSIQQLNPDAGLSQRQEVRLYSLVSHLFTFTAGPLLAAFFFYRGKMFEYFRLHKSLTFSTALWSCLFLLSSFPFAQWVYQWNKMVPMPQWMLEVESRTENLVKALMVMEGPGEFAFNFALVAILPSIGEELLFRGVLQQQIEKWSRSPVAAVWIAAVLFSAFHFQFQGFFPRLILGACLGYLFIWTRNLWAPIVAHLFINGIQLTAQYFYRQEVEKTLDEASNGQQSWPIAIFSLICLFAIGMYLVGRQTKNKINDEGTAA